ncbi:MAG: sugar transferase [Thiotrichaceae bacterium]|nr:sugar transferase [Thiotrichaceae bacterium]
MFAKKIFDLVLILPAVLILSPIFVFIAIAIKLDSKGSVLFKQKRVGLRGKNFHILKFRTMVMNAESQGAKVTTGGDSRITKLGHFLREYKLDELPQLINVLKGEMSLVGPRPEVPEYVEFYPKEMKKAVLSVLPGMTDRASIEFRNENNLLAGSIDPVRDYREKVLPIKLDYYMKYVKDNTLRGDAKIIGKTLMVLVKSK